MLMKVVKVLDNGKCVRMDVTLFPKDAAFEVSSLERVLKV